MKKVVNLFIRPPRFQYQQKQLGPTELQYGDRRYKRTDLQLHNEVRGTNLECSFWEPVDSQRPQTKLPCVIYLHGNTGCRLDGAENVILLLPLNISLFTLDFSAAGWSDGNFLFTRAVLIFVYR